MCEPAPALRTLHGDLTPFWRTLAKSIGSIGWLKRGLAIGVGYTLPLEEEGALYWRRRGEGWIRPPIGIRNPFQL